MGVRIRTQAVALAVTVATSAWAAPQNACTNVQVTGVAFGLYDPIAGAPLDSQGALTFKCTAGTFFVIFLSAGNSGSYNPRAMASAGPDRLTYNLYVDAARSAVFGGFFTPGTRFVFAQATGAVETVPIYGRLFAGQDVAAGVYVDTVIVTMLY